MKVNGMPPLDLGDVTRAPNYISHVGLELEGGWKEVPKGIELVHDGSVRFDQLRAETQRRHLEAVTADMVEAYCLRSGYRPNQITNSFRNDVRNMLAENAAQAELAEKMPKHRGEIPSPPLELDKWEGWLRKYYPSHVNASCGMHVHFSFLKPMFYQRAVAAELTPTTIKYLTAWAKRKDLPERHPIWERMSGHNRYCKQEFYGDRQITAKTKNGQGDGANRYTVWNYCHGLHRTVECRLLPMMDNPDLAVEAIQEVINILNGFLRATRKKEPTIQADAVVDETEYRKELITLVVAEPFGTTFEIG